MRSEYALTLTLTKLTAQTFLFKIGPLRSRDVSTEGGGCAQPRPDPSRTGSSSNQTIRAGSESHLMPKPGIKPGIRSERFPKVASFLGDQTNRRVIDQIIDVGNILARIPQGDLEAKNERVGDLEEDLLAQLRRRASATAD